MIDFTQINTCAYLYVSLSWHVDIVIVAPSLQVQFWASTLLVSWSASHLLGWWVSLPSASSHWVVALTVHTNMTEFARVKVTAISMLAIKEQACLRWWVRVVRCGLWWSVWIGSIATVCWQLMEHRVGKHREAALTCPCRIRRSSILLTYFGGNASIVGVPPSAVQAVESTGSKLSETGSDAAASAPLSRLNVGFPSLYDW